MRCYSVIFPKNAVMKMQSINIFLVLFFVAFVFLRGNKMPRCALTFKV